MTYPELRTRGYTRQDIARALDAGYLSRARRNVYLWREATPEEQHAARVGGRLDCVSALKALGVFVLDREEDQLHLQVPPTASRLRSATDRRTRLTAARDGVRIRTHWRRSATDASRLHVTVIEALAQSLRCQGPRAGIASIDNALFQKLIRPSDAAEVFALLPPRYAALRGLVDGRAESGSETYARLIARATGRSVEVQKRIDGVGRVDLVVDGWIVIECDSREHHGGWEAQTADRLRDLKLAALGYTVIRPTAQILFTRPEVLVAALHGLLVLR
ncbi:hypothetical protein [Microbacterium sp. JZ31]|uniref:hypothetical protein n=1 Tax=Microbacterium sp. JZ31 TaxID=1906274 RepID=UPI00193151D0|nr:hypothetical protein [Microbacterium sp. JZ31]